MPEMGKGLQAAVFRVWATLPTLRPSQIRHLPMQSTGPQIDLSFARPPLSVSTQSI